MKLGGTLKVRLGQERLGLETWHQEGKFSPHIEIPFLVLTLPSGGVCSRGSHFRAFKIESGGPLSSGSRGVLWSTEQTVPGVAVCINISFSGFSGSLILFLVTLSWLVMVEDTCLCHKYDNRKFQGLLERQT